MLEGIFQSLKERSSTDLVFNQYRAENVINNLKVYFEYLFSSKPNLLLVGEAPGYNGCRLTGIPFTSGAVVNKSKHHFFKDVREKIDVTKITTEPTATMFWNVLPENKPLPILWNAFPFHPHEKNMPNSNRKPTLDELNEGKKYLKLICNLFHPSKFAGIGKVGERILNDTFPDEKIFYVRHPSNGGKPEFVRHIQAVL